LARSLHMDGSASWPERAKSKIDMTDCAALIVAAGRGHRFEGPVPKQYASLDGEPLLRRSLRTFCYNDRIKHVSVVINPADQELYSRASADLPVSDPVYGGAERQSSVRLGLEALTRLSPNKVLIHDAARPKASPALINRVMDALDTAQGVVPVLPIRDTTKEVNPNGRIVRTLPRQGLVNAQTPQGFKFSAILDAHRNCDDNNLPDDAAVFEHCGNEVVTVAGEPSNLKVTGRDDLLRLSSTPSIIKVGQGLDIHRFGPGDHLVLGGVTIPHTQGIKAHSDGDVILHALTDAVLGSLAIDDIGVHFPPNDPKYQDTKSEIFVLHALELLREKAGSLVHIDITVICESPQMAPFRALIRSKVAQICDLPIDCISLKATTSEGLGFTGRGEGIAAQATVTAKFDL